MLPTRLAGNINHDMNLLVAEGRGHCAYRVQDKLRAPQRDPEQRNRTCGKSEGTARSLERERQAQLLQDWVSGLITLHTP